MVGSMFLVIWFTAILMWKPIVLLPVVTATGFDVRLDLLYSGSVPASPAVSAAAILGLVGAILIWLTAVIGRGRRRES